jgi:hypothetical protein
LKSATRHRWQLTSILENADTTGSLFEILGGWAAQTRWQRTGGHGFPVKKPLTPEDVISKWDVFTNFGKQYLIMIRPLVLMIIVYR